MEAIRLRIDEVLSLTKIIMNAVIQIQAELTTLRDQSDAETTTVNREAPTVYADQMIASEMDRVIVGNSRPSLEGNETKMLDANLVDVSRIDDGDLFQNTQAVLQCIEDCEKDTVIVSVLDPIPAVTSHPQPEKPSRIPDQTPVAPRTASVQAEPEPNKRRICALRMGKGMRTSHNKSRRFNNSRRLNISRELNHRKVSKKAKSKPKPEPKPKRYVCSIDDCGYGSNRRDHFENHKSKYHPIHTLSNN